MERRTSRRWRVPFMGFLRKPDWSQEVICSGQDLSYKGMRVSSPKELRPEDFLEIAISLPEKKPIKTWGRVAWSVSLEKGNMAGISFSKIMDTDKNEIFDYVMKVDPQQVRQQWWQDV